MALSRKQKEQRLEGYADKLGRAQVVIWCGNFGLTVEQSTELRRTLRGVGAEIVVVKNTIMQRALEGAGLPLDPEIMGGPRMVTFIRNDIAPAATALTNFARQNENVFKIAGGLVGGRLADEAQIRFLATLPTRDVLLAQVVGGIQAPISGFVGTLAAVIRGLANVLNARSSQLEEAAS